MVSRQRTAHSLVRHLSVSDRLCRSSMPCGPEAGRRLLSLPRSRGPYSSSVRPRWFVMFRRRRESKDFCWNVLEAERDFLIQVPFFFLFFCKERRHLGHFPPCVRVPTGRRCMRMRFSCCLLLMLQLIGFHMQTKKETSTTKRSSHDGGVAPLQAVETPVCWASTLKVPVQRETVLRDTRCSLVTAERVSVVSEWCFCCLYFPFEDRESEEAQGSTPPPARRVEAACRWNKGAEIRVIVMGNLLVFYKGSFALVSEEDWPSELSAPLVPVRLDGTPGSILWREKDTSTKG